MKILSDLILAYGLVVRKDILGMLRKRIVMVSPIGFLVLQTSFQKSSDKNECTLGTHDCPDDSACRNTQGSFVCDCKLGFKHDIFSNKCVGKFLSQDSNTKMVNKFKTNFRYQRVCRKQTNLPPNSKM